MRDRWRRQERECRIAMEAAAERRRQSLMPPVRYSTLSSHVRSNVDEEEASNNSGNSPLKVVEAGARESSTIGNQRNVKTGAKPNAVDVSPTAKPQSGTKPSRSKAKK